jgi:hypothetical protein
MLLTWAISYGQELVTIRDTVNHFSIGVPAGWKSGTPANKFVLFVAYRQPLNEQDLPIENFNINILHRQEVDLEKSYQQFLKSVGQAEGFKIIEEGNKMVNGRKYKTLIETHKNPMNNEDMHNHVLFTNNNGEILILTMVAASSKFEKVRELFDRIAISLSY